MLAFLGKPKWILLGVLVVIMVVSFIGLGFWQLGRLQGVRAENQHILATRAAASAPVQQLMRVGAPPTAQSEYRTVTATGRWDSAHQILVRYRQVADDNGLYVLTPLVLADGNRVLVARGWIPPGPRASIEQPVPAPVAGPDGTVSITGRVRLPEGGDEHRTTVGGLVSVTRINPATLPAGGPVYDGYVELVSQNPAVTGALPQAIPQGTLSEGNHESYAYQWFTFGVIAVGGYVLLAMLEVRKRRRERAKQPDSPGHVTVEV